jgi:hypothetical protein
MSRRFDPLCPYSEATQVVSDVPGPLAYCQCDLIARVRADEQRDLRAKVEALTPIGVVYPHGLDVLVPRTLIDRADVLALFNGSQR